MPITSLEKIAAGLGARKNLTAGGLPVTVKDIKELRNLSATKTQALAKAMERLSADIAKRREQAEAEFADFRVSPDGTVRSQRMLDDFRRVQQEQLSEHRRTVIANSDAERTDHLRALQDYRETVATARDLFASPVQMLTAEGIGGDRRARIFEEIRHLGGAALANLAKRAAAEGDRELAAALVSVNDALPSDRRAFSSQELAEIVMGDDHRTATEAMATIEADFQRALDADRELRTGRRDSLATIRRGIGPRPPEEPQPEPIS